MADHDRITLSRRSLRILRAIPMAEAEREAAKHDMEAMALEVLEEELAKRSGVRGSDGIGS
jgi:hypothetical protein